MSAEATISDVLEGRARWCVAEGDCMQILPTIPDKAVAHTLTDPPYSANLYARTRTNKGSGLRPNGRPVWKGEREDDKGRSAAQLSDLRIGAIDTILAPVAAEFLRLTRRWLVIFHDEEISDRWRSEMGRAYVRKGIWVKPDAMPQITGDRPGQGHEPCTIAHPPGRKRWNSGGKAAIWTHTRSNGAERPDHPCPKPLSLMRELVEDFTDPDDVVLDAFAGSGTTGAACVQLGRRAILVERDPIFADLIRRRLEACVRDPVVITRGKVVQSPLFDAREE